MSPRKPEYKRGRLIYLQGAYQCSVVEDHGDSITYLPIEGLGNARYGDQFTADANLFGATARLRGQREFRANGGRMSQYHTRNGSRVAWQPSAAAVAAIRALIPDWRARLHGWGITRVYDGHIVDHVWLEREWAALRDAEAWVAEWGRVT